MTKISKLRRNWEDVYWWKRKVPYWLLGLYYRKLIGNKGIYVMEEDWDNLIILDACRYDYFKDVAGVNANYTISRGSSTREFIRENFVGKKYDDTVVVTANPNVDILSRNSFHMIFPVWDYGWDSRLNTVLPQTIFEHSLKAEKNHPDKRLIIWFMQPHFPYIRDPEISPHGYKGGREKALKGEVKEPVFQPFEQADRGNLSIEELWKAYRRNIKAVIPYAFDLAKKLKGKTVITSDHGEAFRQLFFPIPVKIVGHPPKIHIAELTNVPWLVFDSKERKQIRDSGEDKKVKEKIRKLRKSKKL